MTKDIMKQEKIEVRITDKDKKVIKRLAKESNLSVSEYVRLRSLKKRVGKKVK